MESLSGYSLRQPPWGGDAEPTGGRLRSPTRGSLGNHMNEPSQGPAGGTGGVTAQSPEGPQEGSKNGPRWLQEGTENDC